MAKNTDRKLDRNGNDRKNRRSITWFAPHHTIERQTIYVATVLTLLGSGFVVSQVRYNHLRYEQLMKVDQAGASSTFSKSTNTTLTLGKTRLSPSRHTAYIPITWSSTDQVGIKAKNYRFYITSASHKPMRYKFTGNFVMYGTDGRGILVLHSPNKIQNQPLVMFVVNQRHVPTADEEQEANQLDQSDGDTRQFGKFDVAPFKINPGAIDVQKRDRLNLPVDDMQGLYETVFGSADARKIHKSIEQDQKDIKEQIAIAEGLRERLEDAGYKVPKNPSWLKSDWKPAYAVNVNTGKTANGHDALTYEPDEDSDGQDNSSDNYGLPRSLKNSDGTTTDDANQNSDSDSDSPNASSSSSATRDNGMGDNNDHQADNDSNTNANKIGGTSSDPSKQWQDLQTAWLKIRADKEDIYFAQAKRLYRIRKQERGILSHATLGPSKAIVQRGKVEVPKK